MEEIHSHYYGPVREYHVGKIAILVQVKFSNVVFAAQTGLACSHIAMRHSLLLVMVCVMMNMCRSAASANVVIASYVANLLQKAGWAYKR